MSLKHLEKARWPLNLRWSVADMDKLQDSAKRGYGASALAFMFDTTEVEIREVCDRNAIYINRRFGK